MAVSAEAILQRLLPIVPLLVSMGVHFMLVSFYLLSANWLPVFVFSHTVLFLVGLWALLDKESIEAVISYIVVVAFTILLDIIQLGLYFEETQDTAERAGGTTYRTWQFSAACAIMNLLFKPLSIALASIVLYIRAGGSLGKLGQSDSYATVHGSNEPQSE